MGIVSFCPNGHRTKLKDRFAGLRVRCPMCGAKFFVEPGLPAGDRPEQAAGAAVGGPPERSDAAAAERQSTPTPTALAAAADAVWCVAFPGGEPSEPRSTAAMQAWLEGDEPTGDELVWRTGWSDWKSIAAVFPECFGSQS